MSEATYIELPTPPKKSRKGRFLRNLIILLCIAAVIAAGAFSWWLAQGKIASSFARVDAMIYTVDANFPTVMEELLVHQGEMVTAGQPLAHMDTSDLAHRLAGTSPQQDQHGIPPMGEIAGRLDATETAERRMATRLAQARAEEERYQQIHQERVTDHVRAQLALRAIDAGNVMAHEQAKRMELLAKSRMDQARDEFEKVSKMRASMEMELHRIRAEIFRKKQRASQQVKQPVAPPPPPPIPAAARTLYAVANGQIMGINAVPGQKIPAGTPVFYILPADQSSEKWVEAWFPANAKTLLKLGQKAQIKAQDIHLNGVVSAISEQTQTYAQGSSGEYAQYLPVRIQIPDQEGLSKIPPGTTVECQIQTRYLLGEKLF